MTIHYGKRNPGQLTAASPGDTIYIPLNFFNDSGASIGIGSTLAITDIECFKNGSVTQRATDSGYAILGDTGNFDNRVGFKGISISLFNTADDATFYAVGSTYWVAIDSVTVDGRTVRFFPAIFEIGADLVDTGQVNQAVWQGNATRSITASSDTGVNDRLSRIGFDVDTGLRTHISDVDTGLHDTMADYDTGIRALLALRDTGAIATAVWAGDTGIRALLALRDTGAVSNAVWASQRASHATSGSFGEYVFADVTRIDGDTGSADVLAKATNGVGGVSFSAGIAVNSLAAAALATITDAVWDESDTGHADTGTFGRLRQGVNISKVNDVSVGGTGDTGAGTPWGPT